MDTARYPRKTSEASVKKHSLKLKDVGMVVPKVKKQDCTCNNPSGAQ